MAALFLRGTTAQRGSDEKTWRAGQRVLSFMSRRGVEIDRKWSYHLRARRTTTNVSPRGGPIPCRVKSGARVSACASVAARAGSKIRCRCMRILVRGALAAAFLLSCKGDIPGQPDGGSADARNGSEGGAAQDRGNVDTDLDGGGASHDGDNLDAGVGDDGASREGGSRDAGVDA